VKGLGGVNLSLIMDGSNLNRHLKEASEIIPCIGTVDSVVHLDHKSGNRLYKKRAF
jgi:hypothetical protein